jgi:hypothetical protein
LCQQFYRGVYALTRSNFDKIRQLIKVCVSSDSRSPYSRTHTG